MGDLFDPISLQPFVNGLRIFGFDAPQVG